MRVGAADLQSNQIPAYKPHWLRIVNKTVVGIGFSWGTHDSTCSMLVDKVSQIYLVENCVDVDKIAACVNLDGRGSTYNDKTSYSSCSYTVTKHACCISIIG